MQSRSEFFDLNIQTLGYYIRRALGVMIKRLNKELKNHGLNIQHSDYIILRVLNIEDGLSQSQLSKILGKEKSGISRSLNSLEKDNYIYRTAANGCTNKVFLSDKGKKIIPLLNNIADSVTERAFTGFTDKKRKEMMENLTKVYKNSL